jgi:hypothetical protein
VVRVGRGEPAEESRREKVMDCRVRLLGLVVLTGAVLAHLSCGSVNGGGGSSGPGTSKVPPSGGAIWGPLEYDTNRPGSDIWGGVSDQANPNLCKDLCRKTAGCKAYTWVKAGVQANKARCWLKNKVPPPVNDQCCVSGMSSEM